MFPPVVGRIGLFALLAVLGATHVMAQRQQPQQPATRARRGAAGAPGPGQRMDYRPFFSSSLTINPPRPPAPARGARGAATRPTAPPTVVLASRAITVDVGNDAAMSFDTDTCRMAAGWTGGFLNLSRTNIATLKGSGAAAPAGTLLFRGSDEPGWTIEGHPTDAARVQGALPRDAVHYRGLYRQGNRVVFSYSVFGVNVLEMPGSVAAGDLVALTRTFRVEKTSAPLTLHLFDASHGGSINLAGVPEGTRHSTIGSTAVLTLPPLGDATTFTVILSKPNGAQGRQLAEVVQRASAHVEDLIPLCKGGPATLGDPIVTQGRRAPDGNKAYVVDTIALPADNPSHTWMRTSALDFFADGRCAVCTFTGDVWVVSGIDAALQHVKWKRFATGLYEPLGLRVVDDKVYVLGRDQITRLYDLNGDGEADFYENFNNDGATSPVYHAFKMDLQTDSQGNFYYTVDGNMVPLGTPMHSAIVKVSKDGSKSEVLATGFRAPDGAGMLPDDTFTCADNQGHFTPVCRINLVKPGGFYGYPGDPRVLTRQQLAAARKDYDLPLCWIPYEKDNSTGGQVFVTGDKWGPLGNHLLTTSYGKCKLFEVLMDKADGVAQGATVEMPLGFESGIHRARMNPVDGQLYVTGLMGWQTSATKDGCLQRVRYTGKPFYLPTEFHVKSNGIEIKFDRPLDPTTAKDEQSYGVEEWNYRWTAEYGSKKYKPSNPAAVGTDEVAVKSAKLMPDGKTVFLEIPAIHPVMQMGIQVHINAADGTPIECEINPTINHVPGSAQPAVLTSPEPSKGAL